MSMLEDDPIFDDSFELAPDCLTEPQGDDMSSSSDIDSFAPTPPAPFNEDTPSAVVEYTNSAFTMCYTEAIFHRPHPFWAALHGQDMACLYLCCPEFLAQCS